MVYIPIEPRLGLQPIAVSSATKNHDLGTLIRARDPVYGEGEFIYLLGVAGTVVGSCIIWKGQSSGTPAYQTQLAPGTPNLNEPVAFAMSANLASQYGWYQIGGQAVVATNGVLTAGNTVYLAGAGQLTTTSFLGRQVVNAISITNSGTPSSGLAVVEIDRPFAQAAGVSVTPTLVTTTPYAVLATDVEIYVNVAGVAVLNL